MFLRLDGSRLITGLLRDDDVVVAALGNATFDLYVAADRPLNYYTWGGMGLAASIGLGIALQMPERRVVVLDGDGALFMNPNALTAIGAHQPSNLAHIVWDNGIYQTTGGQPTASATADLEGLARASGIRRATTARTIDELRAAIAPFFAAGGPGGPLFVRAIVSGEGPVTKPAPDPLLYRYRFLDAIRTP